MYALLLTSAAASIVVHTTLMGSPPMNRLNLARRTQIINCLVEGNSIRSTERMTDTHRDTVMRLLVETGEG
jgi:transposase-like protein